jgi:hypothetical protein
MATRRFPPPWSVEELDACFIVKDSAGHYFEDYPVDRQQSYCSNRQK